MITFLPRIVAALVLIFCLAPASAAELVMVERTGCHWCERWNDEIGAIFPNTEENKRAPLRRVNINNLPQDIEFSSKPVFTPTFVLVDHGQELGRLEGYAGEHFFWPLLGQLLDAHPDATAFGS